MSTVAERIENLESFCNVVGNEKAITTNDIIATYTTNYDNKSIPSYSAFKNFSDEYNNILNLIYPIGSIYIAAANINPNNFLRPDNTYMASENFWIWSEISNGVFLRTASTNEELGTLVNSPYNDPTSVPIVLPSHRHNINNVYIRDNTTSSILPNLINEEPAVTDGTSHTVISNQNYTDGETNISIPKQTETTGEESPTINILPTYLTCKMWQRIK